MDLDRNQHSRYTASFVITPFLSRSMECSCYSWCDVVPSYYCKPNPGPMALSGLTCR